MQCPVCRLPLVIVEFQGVELDACLDAHGVWFDEGELEQLFLRAGAPERLGRLASTLEALAAPPEAPRRCLRCGARMEQVRAPARPEPVVLDRCPRGHGLWFDQGELERILDSDADPDDPGLGEVRAFLARFGAPARSGGKEHA